MTKEKKTPAYSNHAEGVKNKYIDHVEAER